MEDAEMTRERDPEIDLLPDDYGEDDWDGYVATYEGTPLTLQAAARLREFMRETERMYANRNPLCSRAE